MSLYLAEPFGSQRAANVSHVQAEGSTSVAKDTKSSVLSYSIFPCSNNYQMSHPGAFGALYLE